MDQSFNMEPATATDSKRKCVQHVPLCEVKEMTNEQQAVVARYREQQDAKSRSMKGPELVYSVEQRKALELMAERKCPIAQQDGYDTVWCYKLESEKAYHFNPDYQSRRFQAKVTLADSLTGFVDQLNAPAGSAFPTLAGFDASSTNEALKWIDLAQDTVYQILSTRTVNTQHGQSLIPSLTVHGHVVC